MTDCTECEEIAAYAGLLDRREPLPEVDPRGTEITRWSGMIAPWEVPTGDRRTFARDSLEHRPLPLPLKWGRTDDGGHKGSVIIGQIEGIEYREDGVYAWGILYDPDPEVMPRLAEDVAEARLLLGGGAGGLGSGRGSISPSVDLAAMEAEALDPTGAYAANGTRPDIRVLSGEIGAVTLVPVAAFKEVRPFALDQIEVGDYEALVASARLEVPVRRDWSAVPVAYIPWDPAAWLGAELDGEINLTASALYQGDRPLFPVGQMVAGELHLIPGAVGDAIAVFSAYQDELALRLDAETRGVMAEALEDLAERCDLPAPTWVDRTASLVASAAPLAPPDEWFTMPEPDQLTPFTVTPEGRVYGHIADKNTCHVGFPGKCKRAPVSMTKYALAHTGAVLTASGQNLDVGRITLGGGHADTRFGVRPAQEHYDNAATCVAIGKFSDGKHGIWFSGSAVPEATEAQLAALRRHPPSGDWREWKGNPELILAHAVNTGGFPVPRYRMEGDRVKSLTAAGALHVEPERVDDGVDSAVELLALAGAAAAFRR